MSDPADRQHPMLGMRWLLAVAGIAAIAAIAFVVAPVEQDTLVYRYRPAADSAVPTETAAASLALARPGADALR